MSAISQVIDPDPERLAPRQVQPAEATTRGLDLANRLSRLAAVGQMPGDVATCECRAVWLAGALGRPDGRPHRP